MGDEFDRRRFLQSAVASSLLPSIASAKVALPAQASAPAVSKNTLDAALRSALDAQMTGYLSRRNGPGMQFAVTDLHGAEYIASYGMENLQTGKALAPDRLFQIGSISKSMGVICILQLVDEGRLDLHKPVKEYLPWLAWQTPFGAVTLHHVLTHTTGLPGGGALFFPADRWEHRQRYAPGQRYSYSNMAYNVIGHLVSQADARPYADSLRERAFKPVGMTSAAGQLGGNEWLRQAVSYISAAPDKPYRRFDALREAPAFHEETSAGCVAATPADMAAYLRCLLRGGIADNGRRVLSEKAFATMTTRHVNADEWGKGAGYAYGLGTDTVHGDQVLVHTGGMVSFMSAIYLNLTKSVAAFASINAQQGYRPTAAARWATEALAASQSRQPLPAPPEIPAVPAQAAARISSTIAADLQTCIGSYVNDDPWNGSCEVTAKGGALMLDGAKLVPLQDGSFWVESEPGAPERCAFFCTIEGKAQVLSLNGTEYHRFRKS